MSPMILLATALYGSAVGMTAAAAPADRLATLVWKARPVVVLADSPDDPGFKAQMTALDAKAHALADYDIALLRVDRSDPALRRKLGVPATGFAVVLIGKDGGVKERWREPVDPARILALIDTMPMRQDEARKRR